MSDTNLDLKHVDFIQATGEGLKAAEYIADALEAQQAKLAAHAPDLAKQLVALKLIDSTEQTKAAELLQDPVEVQTILGRLLRQRTKEASSDAVKTAGVQGQLIADTSAPARSASPFVGARGGHEKTASDLALLRLVPGYTG